MFFSRRADLSSFVLELTPDCNHRCAWCYNAWRHRDFPPPSLGLEDWKRIVLKLERQARPRRIALSGGEPLLHPQAFELIEFIRARSIGVNLLTNGSLLDEAKAGRLVKAGVSVIEIPLPAADRERHAVAAGADDFEAVTAAFANVKVKGGSSVAVFVATKENIDRCGEVFEFAVFLGARGFMFNRVNPASREHLDLLPSPAQLERALGELDALAAKHRLPVSVSVPVPPCVLDLGRFKNISYGYCPRGGKGSYYTVDFCGNLRTCNHSPVALGNLLERDLGGLLKHPYVSRFKEELPAFCRGCAKAAVCGGCCPASAEAVCGDLAATDPFVKACARPGWGVK
ncbi:MAG: radical SAM protein [Elusimicrobiales bacterium]|nr:radical SAM protein [Elusimicrobiales bacterium]